MSRNRIKQPSGWARWVPLWVVPALMIMAIGTVWLRLLVVRTTYDLNQTENTLRNLKREREQLELKSAGLRSPRRLESLAKAKFGLVPPKPGKIIPLNP